MLQPYGLATIVGYCWLVLPCCVDIFDGLYKVKAPVPNRLSSLFGSPYHFIKLLQPLAKINLYVWQYILF